MKAVYFGEELHARAPVIMGMLCRADDGKWIGLAEVVAAMNRGETITIRPATAGEMQRATALVEANEVGQKLGRTLGALYKNQGPDIVEDAVFYLHEAIMAAELPAVQLLDKE